LLEITEDGLVLAYVRPRVGAAVGGRVEARAVEEVILDELQVSVAGQDLVVDVTALGVRRDDQAGNPSAW